MNNEQQLKFGDLSDECLGRFYRDWQQGGELEVLSKTNGNWVSLKIGNAHFSNDAIYRIKPSLAYRTTTVDAGKECINYVDMAVVEDALTVIMNPRSAYDEGAVNKLIKRLEVTLKQKKYRINLNTTKYNLNH